MKDYIINSFILQDKNSLIDIYNYIKLRYDNLVEINDIKTELTKLIKNNIIFFHNKNYKLSNEGNVILLQSLKDDVFVCDDWIYIANGEIIEKVL
jgi:predicted transcriptional regulator